MLQSRVAIDYPAMGFQQRIGADLKPRCQVVVRCAGLPGDIAVHA